MSTQTITEFLLERIAEDERHARKLAETDRRPVLSLATTINHPQRLLAECAAKRAIIDLRDGYSHSTEDGAVDGWCALNAVLKDLAAVYKDHDDYQQDWA